MSLNDQTLIKRVMIDQLEQAITLLEQANCSEARSASNTLKLASAKLSSARRSITAWRRLLDLQVPPPSGS